LQITLNQATEGYQQKVLLQAADKAQHQRGNTIQLQFLSPWNADKQQ
jgi:hypothetical protein